MSNQLRFGNLNQLAKNGLSYVIFINFSTESQVRITEDYSKKNTTFGYFLGVG